jgi:microcystin-dependent protein
MTIAPPIAGEFANNPIIIGDLTDVPVPGSFVASSWAQEVSRRVTHWFASRAVRDVSFPNPPQGTIAYCLAENELSIFDKTSKWRSVDSTPAGAVAMSVASTAPVGWLMMNGQVVNNAQTMYPSLWSAVPVPWKSGSSLLLPDTSTRFPIGQGVATGLVGGIGGANSKSLIEANVPGHRHTIDHGHGHSIGANINDGGGTHRHSPGGGWYSFLVQSAPGTGAGGFSIVPGGDRQPTEAGSTSDAGAHNHYVNVTGGVNDVYAGTLSGAGSGAGAAFDVTPAWFGVIFIIRAF